MVGDAKLARQTRLADTERPGDLGSGLITPTGDRDDIAAKLFRVRSGHDADPSSDDHVIAGKESTEPGLDPSLTQAQSQAYRLSLLLRDTPGVTRGTGNTGFADLFDYGRVVSEQHDVIARLDVGGVLSGIRWAFSSATSRSLLDYSPAAGYNSTLLGMMQHVLFCDRLDRVFGTGHYSVDDDADDDAGYDVVLDQLTPFDVRTMPKLDLGVVVRSDLNGSPGWAHRGARFLLQSAPIDRIETLPWSHKRPTKQQVAKQPDPEPDLGMLADLPGVEQMRDALAVLRARHEIDMPTFVVAHALDGETGRFQLEIGRPRFHTAIGDEQAWWWLHDLLDTPPPRQTRSGDSVPPTGPDGVPDASVRLRGNVEKRKADEQ